MVLKTAINLVDKNGAVDTASCVSILETDRTDTSWGFQISMNNCLRRGTSSTLGENGNLQMILTLDANKKLSRVTLASTRIDEQNLDAYRTSLSKAGSKARADIQDQVDLDLRRTAEEPLTFQVLKAVALTHSTIPGAKGAAPQVAVIKSMVTGKVVMNRAADTGLFSATHVLNANLCFGDCVNRVPPYYTQSLQAKATEPNQETLGACPVRQGHVILNADYTKPFGRSCNDVNYDANSLKITDPKKNAAAVGTSVAACDPKATEVFGGLFSVDWSRVLLF
jgi:hypothetical protein